MSSCGFDQDTGPDDVCGDADSRPGDRSVDIALGGEVNNDVDAIHQAIDEQCVTDITLDELVTPVGIGLDDRCSYTCVGECIQIDHRGVRFDPKKGGE